MKQVVTHTLLFVISGLCVLFLIAAVFFNVGIVHGHSMDPTIKDGDIFIYQDVDSVETGDVVIVKNSTTGMTVIHRVIREHESSYSTKGDNNTYTDGWRANKNEIQGKYLFKVPTGEVIQMEQWSYKLRQTLFVRSLQLP